MDTDKVLVVDDEEDILEVIRHTLTHEGYTVLCARSGEEALAMVMEHAFDLIILDLMLPGLDGLDVTKRLKNDVRTRNIPIIMLTAKCEEADIVTGLELGADDYIAKPFSPKVFLARLKTVLRRPPEVPEDSDEVLRIHDIDIHLGRREVKAGGKPIDITFTEFQILFSLAVRPGWVLTRSQILGTIRGDDYPVNDRSVDVQIVGLRKKLGKYGDYIQTVRGAGYRFKERR